MKYIWEKILIMKKILLFLFLCLVLACTTNDSDFVSDSNPINSLIYGEWVVKEGNVTGFIIPGNLSQSIEFKSNGNFKEVVYCGAESSDLFSYFDSKDCVGNWTGNDNIITLNDWDGAFIEDKIYVISITEDELKLSFKGNTLKYVRKESELYNLKNEIVGHWRYFSTIDKTRNYDFKNDGTGRYKTYYSFRDFVWWIEDYQIVLHNSKIAGGLNEYLKISFVNDKYMGLNDFILTTK
jgi:hypothetical protein